MGTTIKGSSRRGNSSGKDSGRKSKSAGKEEGARSKRSASAHGDTRSAKKPGKPEQSRKETGGEAQSRSQGSGAKTGTSGRPGTKKSAKSRTAKLKYKKGQEIVYPLQGVGQIRSIEERAFRNTRLLYYIIYLEVSDMTIMVPVDKADELGIRSIVDKRQANKALKLISEDYEPVPTDWKARYQNNLDLLKKGSVLDIATVVRALYHRSRIKELPILERKLYDSALKLLVDEISFSLQKGKEEVEELVLSKMELS
jgi:CarD family transcriptional regulator